MKLKLSEVKVKSFITSEERKAILAGAIAVGTCPHNTAGCCPESNGCPPGGTCKVGTDGCCRDDRTDPIGGETGLILCQSIVIPC